MKLKSVKQLVAIACFCILSGCGGGGSSSGTNVFDNAASDPSGGTTVKAADLIVQLSKATIDNTGVDSVILTITAVDANRVAVPNASISVTADSQAVFSVTDSATGADGKLQATLGIGASRANRVITATVKSGSLTKTSTIQVIGASLAGTLVPAVVAPGGAGKITYRLTDKLSAAMANESITVTAAGLTPSILTGTTGSNGDFEFNYSVPLTTSGAVTISAIAGGASDSQILQVQSGSGGIPDAVGTILSASVSGNPSVVGVNQIDSTSNRSVIRAAFLGANNTPIKNVRVKFDLNGDANSIGGTFSNGTAVLYSDANGVVTTSYIPGTRSSPTGGLTVRACYGMNDLDYQGCTTSAMTTLTVASEPLGVSIGTNGLVIVNELTYVKKFVVSVVDSAGRAMPGVSLAASVDLERYRKGQYGVVGINWAKISDYACVNEDTNRNGSIDFGDDVNNDARLEPGKSDVILTLLQDKTRDDGTAELQLTYAQSFASWVDARITVSASGVAGTEGRANYVVASLPYPAVALTTITVEPAFVRSPYGLVTTTVGALSPCQNPN